MSYGLFFVLRVYSNAPGGPNTCWVGNFRVGIFGGDTNLGSGSPVICLSSLAKTQEHIFSEKMAKNSQKQKWACTAMVESSHEFSTAIFLDIWPRPSYSKKLGLLPTLLHDLGPISCIFDYLALYRQQRELCLKMLLNISTLGTYEQNIWVVKGFSVSGCRLAAVSKSGFSETAKPAKPCHVGVGKRS